MSKAANEKLTWVTSSYSGAVDCVQWARPGTGALVRDSKRPAPRVPVSASAWQQFVDWAGQQPA